MLTKLVLGCCGSLCTVLGLLLLLNAFYNAGGLLGLDDFASGGAVETGLATALFALLASCTMFFAYRLLRRAFTNLHLTRSIRDGG
jgi:hypothetical protein